MTLPNIYYVDSLVRLAVVFTDPFNGNDFLDPTTPKLTVRSPSGLSTTYTYGVDSAFIKDSVGHYHYDLSLTAEKIWYYAFWSPGPIGKCLMKSTLRVQAHHLTF